MSSVPNSKPDTSSKLLPKWIGGLLILTGALSLYNISKAISDDNGKKIRLRIDYCRVLTNSGMVLLGGWLVAKPDQWNKPYSKWIFGGLFLSELILFILLSNLKYE